MSFLDLFSAKADLYAMARPRYPDALYEFVAGMAPRRDTVWDCGTGNGQAALSLARYFDAVWASDASAAQIANATVHPRVGYSVQAAEATDFAPASFDAVCVAQALHWFDFDRFWEEVRRVLKPDGLFIAWGYNWFSVDAEIDREFGRTVLDVIRPYWPERSVLLWNNYRGVLFPFTPIESPLLQIEVSWDLNQMLAYVYSWSGTQRCIAECGTAFLDEAERFITLLWGDPGTMRRVTMPLIVLAGRVS